MVHKYYEEQHIHYDGKIIIIKDIKEMVTK
jgi:hypothetical protein